LVHIPSVGSKRYFVVTNFINVHALCSVGVLEFRALVEHMSIDL
jgi:hypothetical protein